MEAAKAKGRPLPDDHWYNNKPPFEPEDVFYLDAFWLLSSCRAITDSHLGPIPWRDIVEYAGRRELEDDMSDLLVRVITEMDAGYLAWRLENTKKPTAPPPKDGDPTPPRKLGR